MSVKRYGIYLAYPPTVDLRAEGLGRHLAMLLKGVEKLDDVHFSIVCPSWSRKTLEQLFDAEQVSSTTFEIVTPAGLPYSLRLFDLMRRWQRRPATRGMVGRTIAKVTAFARGGLAGLLERAVSVHTLAGGLILLCKLALISLAVLPLMAMLLAVAVGSGLVFLLTSILKRPLRPARRVVGKVWAVLCNAVASPKQQGWVVELHEALQRVEQDRMHALIDQLPGIRAWYCPTAFWPDFNRIRSPRLICVPDVVLSDFPTPFSKIGGDRVLSSFKSIEQTIHGGDCFVTYSETVKWDTLVDRYSVNPDSVFVVGHAPNLLSSHVEVKGFPDSNKSSRAYCGGLFNAVIQRCSPHAYLGSFSNPDIKYLFYASQLRPNKNVITLLRAYEYLLRSRFIGHKLVLTGRPGNMPEIEEFVRARRLEHDVIFLHGLSVRELAACYKLADLAVNPSLSEGGCPFTFTEALSVGTPVVMARIPVAEEVLTEPALQKITFFDPYDWRDCADRIEWALSNKEQLLSVQNDFYSILSQRTWADVAAEYVQTLDLLAVRQAEIS